MKTHFSNADYAKKMMQKMLQLATCLPPAILFEKGEKKKKSDKGDEKEKYKTFEIKLNKKEKDSDKLDSTVEVFEDGTPEEFCKWQTRYNEVEIGMPLDTLMKQVETVK